MTRFLLKKRAGVAPAPSAAALQAECEASRAGEFAAECEALRAAVAETLEAVAPPAVEAPAVAEVSPGPAPSAPRRSGETSGHYIEDMEFVPAYSFIMQRAGADLADRNGTDQVTLPRQLWEFVLRCLLERMVFDEPQYLACNPDVAAAVAGKKLSSGREHFISAGYFEGRSGGVRVDEAWYLAGNPDVAIATELGKFESGAAQYRLAGASEGRVPSPEAEAAVAMWQRALGARSS